MKLFNKYDCSSIVVSDPGLTNYINLKPIILPKSQGRYETKKFWKSKAHIVERLILKMGVTGHKGKRHWRTSGRNTGKYSLQYKNVIEVFDIIEKKTNKNPIQVLVQAVENASPCAEVISLEYGGIKHPKAVDVAPQRRVDLALRWMTQGAYQNSANKKLTYAQALASIIMQTASNDAKSFAVSKKIETERQAIASR
jgi:small subunit ribosomal protein S7